MIAIYARQSVDKKDSISIESQIEHCKKEFSGQKYKVYTDKGFSGGNTRRPAFEDMIKDIKNGHISKIVVYKLDRISRSITDFANIINILNEYEVDFVSATEKFDTSSPMGRAMVYIIMVFAQLERETIAQRIKDNYYARGEKGLFLGGNTPYGYTNIRTVINGKKMSILEPETENIEFVKEIFRMYSDSNKSLADIQRHLNDNKIKTPGGVNWDTIKINRILRNPVYVKADADIYMYFQEKGCVISNDVKEFLGNNGCLLYGKRDKSAGKYKDITDHVLSIGLHEGIIDSDIWLLCQYKLDKNKQIGNNGKGKHSWLSGKVKCGYCKYAVTVTTYKDTKYFNCRGKSNYKVCNGHSKTLYVNEIETHVEKALLEKISEIKTNKYEDKQEDSYEINQLKIQLVNKDKQIDILLKRLSQAGDVTMKYIDKEITRLDSEKNKILSKIKELTLKSTNNSPTLINVNNVIKNWPTLDLESKKNIAKTMINKIFITDNEIQIEWRY